MHPRILAFAVAVPAAAFAAPADAALSDFRLPAEQPQPEPPSDLQGPVAPDVPASRRAAPSPASTTNSAEPPDATTPAPIEVPTDLVARPTATAVGSAEAPRPTSTTATAVAETRAGTPLPGAPSVPRGAAPAPTVPSGATDAPLAARPDVVRGWLPWPAAALLLVAALALLAWFARVWIRRSTRPVEAPQIERPPVRSGPAEPPPAPAAPSEPLQVSLEPLRLSLTLMNATLAYRLVLANTGAEPLTGLAIGADMIAAHASMSREEQLAGPQLRDTGMQRIERLDAGETCVVAGEFRLPLPQIVPIRQGSAALMLPLARFRVEADGANPLVRTFVIGQPGQGSGLQPFRLDQGPRVYPQVTQHAFA